MRKTKKLLSALLLIAMLSSAMPVLADNAEPAVTESAAAESQGFTVRYELNYYLAPKIAARKIAPGEKAPKVTGYARDGWVFAGWSLEKRGPLYDFSTPVTADLTLYAQWIQLRRNNMNAVKAVQEAETEQETEAPETEAEIVVVETEAPETEAPETEAPEVSDEGGIASDTKPMSMIDGMTEISMVHRDAASYYTAEWMFNIENNANDGKRELAAINNSDLYTVDPENATWIINDYPYTNILLIGKVYSNQGPTGRMQTFTMNGFSNNGSRSIFHSLAEGKNYFKVIVPRFGSDENDVITLIVNRPTENEWENPFTDITEEHPYYNVIKFCAQNGYMGGVTATEFDADSEITNAMLAATLYRVAGSPDVDSDKSNWYSDAMAWMKENQIFRDDNADPNAKVTRLELAYAMLGYTKIVYPNYKPFIISAIAMDLLGDEYEHTCGMATWIDEDRIHPERTCARCAMGIASQTGMLPLYDGNFIPEQLATRANLASSIAGLKQQLFEILKDNPDGFKDPETAQSYWS